MSADMNQGPIFRHIVYDIIEKQLRDKVWEEASDVLINGRGRPNLQPIRSLYNKLSKSGKPSVAKALEAVILNTSVAERTK